MLFSGGLLLKSLQGALAKNVLDVITEEGSEIDMAERWSLGASEEGAANVSVAERCSVLFAHIERHDDSVVFTVHGSKVDANSAVALCETEVLAA